MQISIHDLLPLALSEREVVGRQLLLCRYSGDSCRGLNLELLFDGVWVLLIVRCLVGGLGAVETDLVVLVGPDEVLFAVVVDERED